jgi:hypothetical protein
MEKNVIKDRKEIRLLLSDSLHETLKNLGVSKSGKKVEKILKKTSRKLADKVADKLKREMKKMRKAGVKTKKEKKVSHHEAVAA